MIVFVESNVMDEGILADDSIFQQQKGKLQTFKRGNSFYTFTLIASRKDSSCSRLFPTLTLCKLETTEKVL